MSTLIKGECSGWTTQEVIDWCSSMMHLKKVDPLLRHLQEEEINGELLVELSLFDCQYLCENNMKNSIKLKLLVNSLRDQTYSEQENITAIMKNMYQMISNKLLEYQTHYTNLRMDVLELVKSDSTTFGSPSENIHMNSKSDKCDCHTNETSVLSPTSPKTLPTKKNPLVNSANTSNVDISKLNSSATSYAEITSNHVLHDPTAINFEEYTKNICSHRSCCSNDKPITTTNDGSYANSESMANNYHNASNDRNLSNNAIVDTTRNTINDNSTNHHNIYNTIDSPASGNSTHSRKSENTTNDNAGYSEKIGSNDTIDKIESDDSNDTYGNLTSNTCNDDSKNRSESILKGYKNIKTNKIYSNENISSKSNKTVSSHGQEPLRYLKAKNDDTCERILKNAMKRHNLNENEWRQYILIIGYGDRERVIQLHESPLIIFKSLKKQGLHPTIMLRKRVDFQELNLDNSNLTPGGRL